MYEVGDCVMIDGFKYIIGRTAVSEVILINLKTGNRWTDPYTIKRLNEITEKEMSRIAGEYDIKKLDKTTIFKKRAQCV